MFFGRRLRLFKLLGFEVSIDWSWIIIAVLVTWSLADGLFPHYYRQLTPEVYWAMGLPGPWVFLRPSSSMNFAIPWWPGSLACP